MKITHAGANKKNHFILQSLWHDIVIDFQRLVKQGIQTDDEKQIKKILLILKIGPRT
jgi:hypothetical protein